MAEETQEGVQVAKAEKKIAICGCSDSKDLAPFNDKSWEIWGVNNLFHHIPRYDRWFEIHNITRNEAGEWMRRGQTNFRGQDINAYVKDLAKMKCTVYMQRKWDDIPGSTSYPIEAVKKRFGSVLGWYGYIPEGVQDDQMNYRLYGTNTVTYMILLAIMEGATHIGIWGVDMAVDTEFFHQRPSCEYALGVAIGMGIKVYVPAEADLLKCVYLYGFEEKLNDEWISKLNKMRESMGKREKKAVHEMKDNEQVLHRSDGARRVITHMRKILNEGTTDKDAILAVLDESEKGITAQEQQARDKHAQGYSAQQQYVGAIQASKEIAKIWGTMQ